jgi:hypothetical protein
MTISVLFENLCTYLGATNNLNFDENILNDIKLLDTLEYNESGEQLKQILESSYKDGISGFENVKIEDGKITGLFIDIINSKLTKRYEFSVDDNEISYKLLNPEDINDNADYQEIEFARTKMFGGSQKPKNCIKSTPCGNSCIKKGLRCRKSPSPEQKEIIQKLQEKGIKTNKKTNPTTASPTKADMKLAKKNFDDNAKEYNVLATGAIQKGINPEKDQSVIRALAKKNDSENKLFEINSKVFEQEYREERRQQELKGVVAIKKNQLEARMKERGMSKKDYEVFYNRLKAEGKIFTVKEINEELLQWVT